MGNTTSSEWKVVFRNESKWAVTIQLPEHDWTLVEPNTRLHISFSTSQDNKLCVQLPMQWCLNASEQFVPDQLRLMIRSCTVTLRGPGKWNATDTAVLQRIEMESLAIPRNQDYLCDVVVGAKE